MPTKIPEIGILFLHFRTDPVTLHHLELLRKHNPDAVIVPISNWGETLPGGYNARNLQQGWMKGPQSLSSHQFFHKKFFWRNGDMPVYQWYIQKKEKAKRWVLLEWDTYCTVPLKEHYGSAWNADLACSEVKTYEGNPDWYWFVETDRLPSSLQWYARGAVPLCGILLSDNALSKIAHYVANEPRLYDIFSEFRLGTVAKKLGLKMQMVNEKNGRNMTYRPTSKERLLSPGLHHPVKLLHKA